MPGVSEQTAWHSATSDGFYDEVRRVWWRDCSASRGRRILVPHCTEHGHLAPPMALKPNDHWVCHFEGCKKTFAAHGALEYWHGLTDKKPQAPNYEHWRNLQTMPQPEVRGPLTLEEAEAWCRKVGAQVNFWDNPEHGLVLHVPTSAWGSKPFSGETFLEVVAKAMAEIAPEDR